MFFKIMIGYRYDPAREPTAGIRFQTLKPQKIETLFKISGPASRKTRWGVHVD
jgi:hypothetical protein